MSEEDIAVGFMKFASTQVLSVERETAMSRTASAAGLQALPEYEVITTEAGKTAHRATFDYTRRQGYIYVRSRAISSRTNDNYDEFPAEEIKVAYRTFVGKPVFVNHHNDDHRRARGVIIDAALHEDTNPNGTPDTWVEVLMEVDARRFPRLAAEVLKGNIARTSMGTNVEYSVCTACNNKAYSPVEYCQHIPRMKGMKIRRASASGGGQEEVLIAERCYGLGFFENSLLVEDPADPTAFVLGVEGDGISAAAVRTAFEGVTVPREDITTWRPDPGDVIATRLREAMKTAHWDPHGHHKHKRCRFPVYGLSSIIPCGKDLAPGDVCPDHGPQAQDLQVAAAGRSYEPHKVKAHEVQVGDRLHRNGKTRISKTHHREDRVHYQTKTMGARSPSGGSWHRDEDVTVYRPKTGSVTAATNKATCDECQTPYDYSRISGTATFHVPSNGMRGGGHQAAHDETVEGVTDDEVLWHFECPVCGYDNSQYTDADAYRELLGFRYDTNHVPYQHNYSGTQPHTTEESIPAGSSITDLHNENDPGYGQGGADAAARSQQKADADVTRQRQHLWKQHHPGEAFQGVRTVEASACSQCNPGHGLHAGLLCGSHAHMHFLRTLHGQDAFFPNGHIAPNHTNDGMWATASEPHPGKVWAVCPGCGEEHEGNYSHEGQWGQGHIYAVPCPKDGLTSYFTDEGLSRVAKTANGEVKAPAQVDTMRAERCPVCQDDEAYDGDRCGICGYVAPPEMFQDPDLEKAQQVDLRQDQMEQMDGDGNMAVDTADVEGQGGVLTCDACGEEFGPDAEGEDAPDDGPAPADPAAQQDQTAEADPDAAGDPTQQDRPEAPDDLSDLADKTDEELGVGDDEVGPDAQEDPLQAESPVEQDPNPADGGVDPEDPASLNDQDSVVKGAVCPICGQGTIVSIAPDQPASPDPAVNPKEKSRDMPEQDPKKQAPTNPAKAARNRILAAVLGQQRLIESQRAEMNDLRSLVLEIGKAAGLQAHPRFAALQKRADDTNQTPETAPATTSQDAKQPDAKDDVNNVGAAPDGANVNVTPQAVTDVASTDKVEPGQPPLSNLVDVTAPVAGADAVPAPGDGDKVINPVTVGTPSNDTMDPAGSSGWKNTSARNEDPMERHTASLRLARLRIAAGLVRGEDLAIGEVISKDASMSLDTIKALTAELSQTLSAQAAQAPTRQQTQRLVPRAASGGRAPSLAGDGGSEFDSGITAEGGLDEWAFGLDSLADGE